jgi:TolB-like protein
VFVDTEHGINTAIRKIRTALRDDAERSRFIQTVSGKGYRFVAELSNGDARAVRLETRLETKPPASLTPAQSEPVPAQVHHPAKRLTGGLAAGIAALVLLLIAGVAVGLNIAGLRDRIFARSKVGPIQSLAVLPLVNLSGDSSQNYFADGMTDELITALAQNRSLRVVSRTSAMQYKGVNKPLRDIARALGVDGILEGSVSRSGNRVHINLQLIYAPTDTHLWAQSYDRDTSAVLSLSEEL